MEGLSLDNILGEDQINSLFSSEETKKAEEEPSEDTNETKEEEKETSDEIDTTEINPNELFEGKSESVGSEEITRESEDTSSSKSKSSSNDFYSSIANALVEDGVLQNLDDKDLSKVKSAEDFAEFISDYINSQLDERQKRVSEALDFGVEPSEIQKYERYINILNSVTEEKLTDEDEEGELLRKNLIYQDCLNKGFSKDRALKMVDKSIKAGTDIDDAREALQDNKTFYKEGYDNLLKKAKKDEEERQKELKKQSEELRTSILEEEKVFGDISIDKATRQKVYDSIMKPVYTDPESGARLTAIQKYELEHRTDFLKKIGLLYVLTDEFKNIDRLVTDKVKKETRKNLRSLEHTLKGGNNDFSGGSLSLANDGGNIDPESIFKGWKLSV